MTVVRDQRGKKNPMYGKTPWNKGKKGTQSPWNKGLTKETSQALRKISEKRKGSNLSEETKKKLSKINKGKKLSEETKKKISQKHKGIPSFWKGKKQSEEYKKRRLDAVRKSMQRPETRKKISDNTKKQMQNPKYREAVSRAQKGKKLSEKTKELLSISRQNIRIPRKDTKPEKIIEGILDESNIKYEKQRSFHLGIGYPVRRHSADFVINYKVLECYGTYHHADPSKYKDNDLLTLRKKKIKASDVWDDDAKICAGMEKQGYEILVIWQQELENNIKKTTKKILKFLKTSSNRKVNKRP